MMAAGEIRRTIAFVLPSMRELTTWNGDETQLRASAEAPRAYDRFGLRADLPAGDAYGDDPVVRRFARPVTAAGDRKVVNPIALRCSACEWKRPPRPRTLLGVARLASRAVR